ncbi:BTB/POZ domain-containing protein [Actinidia chinensis var. chinensis]|uniref:BTB/POZ domain-containing protein n=1 Tax=Actinidia chinensis var. chinensis TaxID=1590841 RepID=A0A2R6Q7A7_ACTCC|nr:BTB/POZ domain-containing protein [Actinidia chinensis var. chinensis]
MMRTPSKQGAENNRGISGHLFTLHQRLYHALNLGLRSSGDKGRKWQSSDIEIQRLVIRSIDAFLDCMSVEALQHPLVKESIADMIGALEGILHFTNEATLSLASNVTVKMVNVIPSSILQSPVLDLIRPLTSLLPSHQLQVAVSCATALNLIFPILHIKREGEVWEILKETKAVVYIVNNIHDFFDGSKSIEYLREMVSLLSKILWRWRSSRFCVWSDANLMEVLGVLSLKPDFSVKVAVLQLYSAIALCSNGAEKLLENGKAVLHMMVHCMEWSNSVSVQMEGFRLAQLLAINEEGCSTMMTLCSEPIVRAIINGLNSWSSHSGKISKDQMSLLMEACRLALITRWEGEHHNYFWKLGVDRILLNLLLNNFRNTSQSQQFSSLKEQIAAAQHGLNQNFHPVLRPFIWDILGGLAAHCLEDFDPKMHGNELCINVLITCACLAFVDSIHNTRQLCQNDLSDIFRNESASRSVLMMIYSPCKYIASQVRSILSELLRPNGKEHLKYVLDKLSQSRNKFEMPDNYQSVIYLMILACYSGLPQYRKHIIKNQGIKILVAFIRWCLSNDVHVRRLSMALAPSFFIERTCCRAHTEDWDGDDIPLLFSLWGLAELVHHSSCLKTHPDIFAGQVDYNEAQLVSELQRICSHTSTPGPIWYAAYILSHFGLYGFPSKLGKRMGKVHTEMEFVDLELILTNGEPLHVHSVMLMARCPSLLPPQELPLSEITFDGSLARNDLEKCRRIRKEVRLSAHVDQQALLKLLEYIYLGHLQASAELVKKLKILARHCNLQSLFQMLSRKRPKWGTPIPTFGLTLALEPAGHHFSDIILEAKVADMINWTCPSCSVSVPHMHVHKVILCSSSAYFQGMFRSGMQESHTETIKTHVGWNALFKIVKWFYSDELPKPISGCLWDSLDADDKLHELYPYVELCWLAEYWCLGDDLHEYCSSVVISSLDSARHLSIKVIQIAASLYQKKLAEVAANYMAPLYHQLRNSGELEALDEELADMVRAASVRLSQNGGHPHS